MKKLLKRFLFVTFTITCTFFFISCNYEDRITNNTITNLKLMKLQNSPDGIVLAAIRKWKVFVSDYMLSNGYDENPSGADNEGQLAYILGTSNGAYNNLWRFWNSSIPDHMITTNQNEVNWVSEGRIGMIWKTNVFPNAQGGYGLKKLMRYFGSNGDHTAAFSNPGPIYNFESDYGWAFPRYGSEKEVETSISGSGAGGHPVTLIANKVFGGVIWELWWNGKQFVNHWEADPAGRNITFDMNIGGDNSKWVNEAGQSGQGMAGTPHQNDPTRDIEWQFGSPIKNFSETATKIEAEVWPLFFHPDDYIGQLDYRTHPVMWTGTFAKQVEIKQFNYNGVTHSGIIEWTTTIKPKSTTLIDQVNFLSAHLNNEFCEFYAYNAETEIETALDIGHPGLWTVFIAHGQLMVTCIMNYKLRTAE